MNPVIPKNVILLATHGTYAWPEQGSLDPKLGTYEFSKAYQDIRLRKNFSDFATGELLKLFPGEQVITPPKYSRAFIDPNRAFACLTEGIDYSKTAEHDHSVTKDFNGIKVFDVEPSQQMRKRFIETIYKPYFEQINERIFRALEQLDGPVVVIDIHDTGNLSFNADGTTFRRTMQHKSGDSIDGFVGAVVGDLEGKSSTPEFTKQFADGLRRQYEQAGVDIEGQGGVHINTPYSGAEVIDYGHLCKVQLANEGRPYDAARLMFLQVELNRSRLIDEVSQQSKNDGLVLEAGILSRTFGSVLGT